MSQKPEPPNCPSCGEPLTAVDWEVDQDRYEWTGRGYKRSSEGGGRTLCPNCEADLGDLFSEGPANYTPKKEVKK